MVQSHEVSERQACALVQVNRSSYAYVSKKKADELVINELSELVEKHPQLAFGCVITESAKKAFYGIINVFTEYIPA